MGQSTSCLLIGHFGGSNTGDEAMLRGLLASGELARTRVTVAAKRDSGYRNWGNGTVRCVTGTLPRLVFEIRRHDAVILVGGTHFHDDYALQRLARHWVYMARLAAIFWMARAMKRRVGCVGVSLGPFRSGVSRWLTRLAARACVVISVRDRASLMEARSLRVSARIVCSFDMAALLLRVPGLRITPFDGRPLRLGVNLVCAAAACSVGQPADAHVLEVVTAALERLLKNDGNIEVALFIIRGGKRESDVFVARQLYERLSPNPRLRIIPYAEDPVRTLEEIARCRYFLGSRYHSCLLAYSAGCRALFLAYHRKVADLAQEIGAEERGVLPFSFELEENDLLHRLTELLGGKWNPEVRVPVPEALERAINGTRSFFDALWPERGYAYSANSCTTPPADLRRSA